MYITNVLHCSYPRAQETPSSSQPCLTIVLVQLLIAYIYDLLSPDSNFEDSTHKSHQQQTFVLSILCPSHYQHLVSLTQNRRP